QSKYLRLRQVFQRRDVRFPDILPIRRLYLVFSRCERRLKGRLSGYYIVFVLNRHIKVSFSYYILKV
ncbi:MAG: hypothetical protein M3M84_07485, partial [Thermoproteota archaeon]|nr:hypothetical protein [Thermoproteota archaeon]